MQNAMYRIVSPSGVVIADGLAASAPAIRLDEGRVAVRGERAPKDLAVGESAKVFYPLAAEKSERRREILCTVERMPDARDGDEPAVARPIETLRRGGRRSRSAP